MTSTKKSKVAVVQATPVFMNLEATVEKACRLIAEVGSENGEFAVFPEAFLPGYPLWTWFIPPLNTHPLREIYSILHANSVTVPGPAVDRICQTARESGVGVVIGINEKEIGGSDSTLFNTILFIGADGEILGKHRKLIPTTAEKLIWGRGDGSDLDIYEYPFGRVGGLICWECYMPLVRYAMTAWGMQVLAAPTWDRGEPWTSSMRHSAKECRSFVLSSCCPMHMDDIPDSLSFKAQFMSDRTGWVNPGGSVIVDPDGKIVAGPLEEAEGILYAEIEASQLVGPRWQLDTTGHYARPDIFELRFHQRPTPSITSVIDYTGDIDEE